MTMSRVWVGWMDGSMNGWMDGWIDGWMDSWMNGWMDGRTDGWMDCVLVQPYCSCSCAAVPAPPLHTYLTAAQQFSRMYGLEQCAMPYLVR